MSDYSYDPPLVVFHKTNYLVTTDGLTDIRDRHRPEQTPLASALYLSPRIPNVAGKVEAFSNHGGFGAWRHGTSQCNETASLYDKKKDGPPHHTYFVP